MALLDDVREIISTAFEGIPLFIALMLGPKDPPFSQDTDFKQYKIQSVTVVTLAILLTSPAFIGSKEDLAKFWPYFRNVAVAFIVLILLYMALAWIFRIRLRPEQIFYCFCLLAFPWIPILAFWLRLGVRIGSESAVASWAFFVIGPPLIMIIAACNVARGVRRVSGCPLWRALVSMLAFVAAIVGAMIWIL